MFLGWTCLSKWSVAFLTLARACGAAADSKRILASRQVVQEESTCIRSLTKLRKTGLVSRGVPSKGFR